MLIICNRVAIKSHVDAATSPPVERGSNGSTASSRSETPASLSDGVTLEGVYNLCKDISALIQTMDTRLRAVEDRSHRVTTAVKELNDYIKKYCKSSFSVKGSQYEVSRHVITPTVYFSTIHVDCNKK